MDLIPITKDGVKLSVHPDALDQHKHLGWVQMPEEPEQDQVRRGRKPKPEEPEQDQPAE